MMHQAETARLLGYGDDIEAMNRGHDSLHAALCDWLGIPSLSLAVANGGDLTFNAICIANCEEVAVLMVQRLIVAHGLDVEALLERLGAP